MPGKRATCSMVGLSGETDTMSHRLSDTSMSLFAIQLSLSLDQKKSKLLKLKG
jgi:hypothetical protein